MSYPARFGRYLLLDRLGSGGMAEVFRALPTGEITLDRTVALKRSRPELEQTPGILQMFVDEARIAARLSHPNLGSVLELGCEGQIYYQTMEYLPGVDLHDVLRSDGKRFSLPCDLAAYVGHELAEGLEHVHRLSDEDGEPLAIVHRDVNPRNVRLTFDGRVVLLDFGVARSRHRITKTDTGMVKGKLAYLAPEQLEKGAVIDGRADLYALGITLFEMVTGHHPFSHRDVQQMFALMRRGEHPKPSALCPDAPRPLCDLIERALAPDPEQRWQTAGEMAFELSRVLRRHRPRPDAQAIAELIETSFPERIAAEREADARLERLIESIALGSAPVAGAPPEASSAVRAALPRPEELHTDQLDMRTICSSFDVDLSWLDEPEFDVPTRAPSRKSRADTPPGPPKSVFEAQTVLHAGDVPEQARPDPEARRALASLADAIGSPVPPIDVPSRPAQDAPVAAPCSIRAGSPAPFAPVGDALRSDDSFDSHATFAFVPGGDAVGAGACAGSHAFVPAAAIRSGDSFESHATHAFVPSGELRAGDCVGSHATHALVPAHAIHAFAPAVIAPASDESGSHATPAAPASGQLADEPPTLPRRPAEWGLPSGSAVRGWVELGAREIEREPSPPDESGARRKPGARTSEPIPGVRFRIRD